MNVEYRKATPEDLEQIWDMNIADNNGNERWRMWKDTYISCLLYTSKAAVQQVHSAIRTKAGLPSIKLSFMLFKEIIISTYISKLCPAFHIHRLLIHIINFRILNGQKERRMCSDKELTSVKARGILQKPYQLLLLFRRQTVFRFIQQIKPVFLYFLRKIKKGAFSIGMLLSLIHI